MKAAGRRKPLAGQRILVTRARHQAEALAARLRRLGATVVAVPSIEIRPPRSYQPLDRALRRIGRYDWLILTSVNGARALFSRLRKLRLSRRHLRHLHVAAIGPATRAAVEKRDLRVHVMPAEYVAESVVRSLRSRVKGKRVLLVRARVARDILPRAPRASGSRRRCAGRAAARTGSPSPVPPRCATFLFCWERVECVRPSREFALPPSGRSRPRPFATWAFA